MSSPDLGTFIPAVAAALALSGCASEQVPTAVPIPTPIVRVIGSNPTERHLLAQFQGELLSSPITLGGTTVVDPATLTCALAESIEPGRPPKKMLVSCGVAGHKPPLIPADRREWCGKYRYISPQLGGQISLRADNGGETYIFTSRLNLNQTLGQYSRCEEFTDSNAHAPALRGSIYERPARGRISRREAKMRQLEAEIIT